MPAVTRRERRSPEEIAGIFIAQKKDRNDFALVKIDETIGYGVFAKEDFRKGDFLMEYRGDKISEADADKRRFMYTKAKQGSFIYYGLKDVYGNSVCIDATNEFNSLGRMVNDAPFQNANSKMKRLVRMNEVHLVLFAITDIKKGTEIRYDYGEDSENMPWRSSPYYLHSFIIDLNDPEDTSQECLQDVYSVPHPVNEDHTHNVPNIPSMERIIEIKFPKCSSPIYISDIHCGLIGNNNAEFADNKEDSDIGHVDHADIDNVDHADIGHVYHDDIGHVHHADIGHVHHTDIGHVEHADIGHVHHADIGSVDHADIGHVHHADIGHVDHADIGHVEQADIGPVDHANIGPVDHADIGHVDHADIGYIEHADIGHVEQADIDPVDHADIGPVDHADIGHVHHADIDPVDHADIGPVDHADIGPMDHADIGHVHHADIGHVDHADIGHVDHADIGHMDDSVVYNQSTLNDSGFMVEEDLSIIDTDEEEQVDERKDNKKYKKPKRPCFVCNKSQTRLKRHILTKHKDHPSVVPLLSLTKKEQDSAISKFRRQGIRDYNMLQLQGGAKDFMRERQSENDSLPVMCSGCKGFFSKGYKSRHQLTCPSNGSNLMLPLVSIEKQSEIEECSAEFKAVLNTLHEDEIGNYVKSDPIILMIGQRSHNATKRKTDKITLCKATVRSRMRLTARIYLTFKRRYSESTCQLSDMLNNAADIYRRETISVLGETVNELCDTSDGIQREAANVSITKQKSGLKIIILNLLKLTANLLIGHFLVQNMDDRSKKVVDFLQVLKLFENEMFGDAYYDLKFRANVNSRKPINLPNNNDVELLMKECRSIINSIDAFDLPQETFINIRSAVCTILTIFNARRGGEPVRLTLKHWKEAVDGEWTDQQEEQEEDMLVTFQTGKGGDHLVPVYFPPETYSGMKFLTDSKVRIEAGVSSKNMFVFASTGNSESHASGWHAVNDILKRLDLSGAINTTKNRHRVASLLATIQLSEKEKELIFSHFGHSETINKNKYQAAAGTMQLKTTGKRLAEIHNNVCKDDAITFNSSATFSSKEDEEQSGMIQFEVIPNSTDLSNKSSKTAKKEKTDISKEKKSIKKYPKRKTRQAKKVLSKPNDESSSDDNNCSEDDYYHSSSSNSSIDDEETEISQAQKKRKAGAQKMNRNYRIWTEESKEEFKSKYADFLQRDTGYPTRQSMEIFGIRYGLSVLQVRTRIVNSRAEAKKKSKILQKKMEII